MDLTGSTMHGVCRSRGSGRGGRAADGGPGRWVAQAGLDTKLQLALDAHSMLADRACDTDAIVTHCIEREMEPVIPSGHNRRNPRHCVHTYHRAPNTDCPQTGFPHHG